jgi:hypothetical protein
MPAGTPFDGRPTKVNPAMPAEPLPATLRHVADVRQTNADLHDPGSFGRGFALGQACGLRQAADLAEGQKADEPTASFCEYCPAIGRGCCVCNASLKL